MHESRPKIPWEVTSFSRGDSPVASERLGREEMERCSRDAMLLLDEEAVVRNLDLSGSPGLVLLWREKATIWMGIRSLLRPNEDLSELARVYSMVARGSDATVFTDASAGLLAGSRYWRSIYGFTPGEVIGQNPRIINPRLKPSSFFREMWQQLTDRSIGTWSAELINRRKNGELVYVWQTITTIRGEDGTIQGYLGQTRDMTEIHSVRNQLKRQNEELSKLNQFKGEMVEIMAHDLKAPLQAVLGFTDLAKASMGSAATPALEKNLNQIDQAGKNMLEMIQNFLQLQRSESGDLTVEKVRGNLRSLIRRVVEGQGVVGGMRGVKVVFEEEGPARPQYFDPVRVEQAVNNVVSNAIKYTRESSQVKVRILSREGHPERIEVEDEGQGIPEDELESVFEAYQQLRRSKKGAGSVGWGLAIARKVLELHGGKIWAENRQSGGCRFIMEMPLGYDVFGEAPGAVLLHDPMELWCRPILEELQKWGIPAFVSGDLRELRLLCKQELPDTLIFGAGRVDPLPEVICPDSGKILEPAIGCINPDRPSSGKGIIKWERELNTTPGIQRILQGTASFSP